MKVNGSMIENKGSSRSDASSGHKAAIANQNGKKTRGIRAANLKGQMSKKARRMTARHV